MKVYILGRSYIKSQRLMVSMSYIILWKSKDFAEIVDYKITKKVSFMDYIKNHVIHEIEYIKNRIRISKVTLLKIGVKLLEDHGITDVKFSLKKLMNINIGE